MEVWKTIEGFENYEISNLGNVIGKKIKTSFGYGYKIYPVRDIKQWKDKKGYCYVTLLNLGIKKNLLVHRLVALHFITNIDNKPQINHINGIKSDNYFYNLEWNTAKENLLHARTNKLNNISGTDNYQSKLTEKDVIEIRKNIDKLTQKKLSLKYFITQAQIWKVINFKTYKNVRIPDTI